VSVLTVGFFASPICFMIVFIAICLCSVPCGFRRSGWVFRTACNSSCASSLVSVTGQSLVKAYRTGLSDKFWLTARCMNRLIAYPSGLRVIFPMQNSTARNCIRVTVWVF
jgi:hypothetical protein